MSCMAVDKDVLKGIAVQALAKLENGAKVGNIRVWTKTELQKVRP